MEYAQIFGGQNIDLNNTVHLIINGGQYDKMLNMQ